MMQLHIWIAGRERFSADIEPGRVTEALAFINQRMGDLASTGERVTVALDSAVHTNVTYMLNRRTDRAPQ